MKNKRSKSSGAPRDMLKLEITLRSDGRTNFKQLHNDDMNKHVLHHLALGMLEISKNIILSQRTTGEGE